MVIKLREDIGRPMGARAPTLTRAMGGVRVDVAARDKIARMSVRHNVPLQRVILLACEAVLTEKGESHVEMDKFNELPDRLGGEGTLVKTITGLRFSDEVWDRIVEYSRACEVDASTVIRRCIVEAVSGS